MHTPLYIHNLPHRSWHWTAPPAVSYSLVQNGRRCPLPACPINNTTLTSGLGGGMRCDSSSGLRLVHWGHTPVLFTVFRHRNPQACSTWPQQQYLKPRTPTQRQTFLIHSFTQSLCTKPQFCWEGGCNLASRTSDQSEDGMQGAIQQRQHRG